MAQHKKAQRVLFSSNIYFPILHFYEICKLSNEAALNFLFKKTRAGPNQIWRQVSLMYNGEQKN